MSPDDITPGDWVRFYRDGHMVFGVVAYVRKNERWPYEGMVLTDQGQVAVEHILEVRHA